MPVYEYECQACHREFEYQQRMSDPDKTTCEACGGSLERIISRTAFQLKGSGWYKDLYSSSKPSGESSSSDKPAASSDSGSASAAPAAAASSDSGSSSAGSSSVGSTSSGSSSGGSGSSGSKAAARES